MIAPLHRNAVAILRFAIPCLFAPASNQSVQQGHSNHARWPGHERGRTCSALHRQAGEGAATGVGTPNVRPQLDVGTTDRQLRGALGARGNHRGLGCGVGRLGGHVICRWRQLWRHRQCRLWFRRRQRSAAAGCAASLALEEPAVIPECSTATDALEVSDKVGGG